MRIREKPIVLGIDSVILKLIGCLITGLARDNIQPRVYMISISWDHGRMDDKAGGNESSG